MLTSRIEFSVVEGFRMMKSSGFDERTVSEVGCSFSLVLNDGDGGLFFEFFESCFKLCAV